LQLQDVLESDDKLLTTDTEPLRIVAFKHDAEVKLYIVGYECTIAVTSNGGLLGALLALLMAHYVFDLRYLPQHAMALAVFQTIVMEEPYTGKVSQNLKFFLKSIRNILGVKSSDDC